MSAEDPRPAQFSLWQYLAKTHGPKAKYILGGSATPYQSVKDLIALSTDQTATTQNIFAALKDLPLGLSSDRGSLALRTNIASTYSSEISPDALISTNATTGANHIVERSYLRAGDHVIVQYPIYGPCIEEPIAMGCTLSYLRLDPENKWALNPDDLEKLIIPGKTRMIFLNYPNNPTGSHLNAETQRAVINIAKKHDVLIHCDEIFRPLYHEGSAADGPPSFIDHADLGFDKIVVTSSMSKVYGLSGVRIGWIATRSLELDVLFRNYRMFSAHSTSLVDEVIATEALSSRVRPAILEKHHKMAKTNLDAIQALINKYDRQLEWSRPTAGAVAFVKIKDYHSGKAVDDIEFCERLVEKTGILLSPGSLCFEFGENKASEARQKEFQGRVRLHFTATTEAVAAGIKGLAEFLEEEQASKGAATNGV